MPPPRMLPPAAMAALAQMAGARGVPLPGGLPPGAPPPHVLAAMVFFRGAATRGLVAAAPRPGGCRTPRPPRERTDPCPVDVSATWTSAPQAAAAGQARGAMPVFPRGALPGFPGGLPPAPVVLQPFSAVPPPRALPKGLEAVFLPVR